MKAHILSLHTPSTPGMGSKVITFFSERSHVAYQKNGMEHKTLCNYKVCPYTQHRPLGWVKDQTMFF